MIGANAFMTCMGTALLILYLKLFHPVLFDAGPCATCYNDCSNSAIAGSICKSFLF
jgi:hypothetical protein